MIHHSSNDPVLIKKISLKIWTLRDEIESRLKEEIEKNPDTEINVAAIRESYQKQDKTSEQAADLLELKSGQDLDTSEDEMARAMRGEENDPPEAETINPDNNSIEQTDNNIVQLSSNSSSSNMIEVKLEIPKLEESKISKGKTVLSEINMDKMFFFSNQHYTEGQSIVIQFCVPKMFIINADVLYCRPFNLKSRIISQHNLKHRVLVRFTFLKEGERALLRQFIQSIEPDITKIEKKPAAGADTDDDAGFGELDDLGL